MTGIGDLCDQGRCAQILRGIAEAKTIERVAERNGHMFGVILTGCLSDLGVEVSEMRVREVVAVNIRRAVQEATT